MKRIRLLSVFMVGALVGASIAHAGPTGGNVVAGSAQITTPSSTETNINQLTDKVIVDWQGFDIEAGEKATFKQPNAGSIALNRVVGGDASQIMGTLQSNGQVFLINPDGILFGQNSRLDVGALMATTSNISNDDFLNENYRFTAGGNNSASVVNLGTITAADGGFVGLVGNGVRNSGTINVRFGRALLGAGSSYSIDLAGNGLIHFAVDDVIADQVIDAATGQPMTSLVRNDGTVSASGGTIQLAATTVRSIVDSVVSTTGVVEAHSVGMQNGKIIFSASTAGTLPSAAPEQVMSLSGDILVQGDDFGETGGMVVASAERLNLLNANIDASGDAGGGKLLLGGGYLGGSADASRIEDYGSSLESFEIATASNLFADADTVIRADGGVNGDGGKVILWSDDTTTVASTISARGGLAGGDGGFVETSGKGVLNFAGDAVDASAVNGEAGTWLLDPTNIFVWDGMPEAVTCIGAGTLNCSPSATPSVISSTTINNALQGGTSVTISTVGSPGIQDGDIIIYEDIDAKRRDVTFRLAAADDIFLQDAKISGSRLTFDADAEGFIALRGNVFVENLFLDTTGSLSGNDTIYIEGDVHVSGGQAVIRSGAHIDLRTDPTGSYVDSRPTLSFYNTSAKVDAAKVFFASNTLFNVEGNSSLKATAGTKIKIAGETRGVKLEDLNGPPGKVTCPTCIQPVDPSPEINEGTDENSPITEESEVDEQNIANSLEDYPLMDESNVEKNSSIVGSIVDNNISASSLNSENRTERHNVAAIMATASYMPEGYTRNLVQQLGGVVVFGNIDDSGDSKNDFFISKFPDGSGRFKYIVTLTGTESEMGARNIIDNPLGDRVDYGYSVPSTEAHEGFSGFASEVRDTIVRLQASGEVDLTGNSLMITGHSLGGAAAQLLGAMLVTNPDDSAEASRVGIDTVNDFSDIEIVTFGSPVIGSETFANEYADLPVTRYINDEDGVTTVGYGGLFESNQGDQQIGDAVIFPGEGIFSGSDHSMSEQYLARAF